MKFKSVYPHKILEFGPLSVGGFFGDYEITGETGEGTTGKIFECTKCDHPHKFCLKVLNKRELLSTKAMMRVSAELDFLQNEDSNELHEKNILPILEVIHSKYSMCYMMELFGINLLHFSTTVVEDTGTHLKNSLKVIREISVALQHTHSHGYAHRDIKGENILVQQTSDGQLITNIRLIDFGIICRLDHREACSEICGTPGFIAPEVVMGQVRDATKVDIWSLACVILERCVSESWFHDYWTPVTSSYKFDRSTASFETSPIEDATIHALGLIQMQPTSILRFMNQALVVDPKRRANLTMMEVGRNNDIPQRNSYSVVRERKSSSLSPLSTVKTLKDKQPKKKASCSNLGKLLESPSTSTCPKIFLPSAVEPVQASCRTESECSQKLLPILSPRIDIDVHRRADSGLW